MRPIKLAAPASNWLRQPPMTTTDVQAFGLEAGEVMARAAALPIEHPTDRLLGRSPAISALRAQIRHLATFDAVGSPHAPTVLLQGETGTGKGLVARVIHDSGPRAQGPFIDVNCAAIPETLLEAELFGFEAGTFTDAKRAKPGLLEAASGGTLFLDEIEALPPRAAEQVPEGHRREVGAGGSGRCVERPSTSRSSPPPADLAGYVAPGRFRPDLYHRLAVVVVDAAPVARAGGGHPPPGRAVLAPVRRGAWGAPEAAQSGGRGVAAAAMTGRAMCAS